jgi:very-short-patch-repair endonuclease
MKRARPGVCTHRGPLDGDVVIRNGIPVTTVARTIVDLAHELDEDEIRRMVREAQYLRIFSLAATQAANRRWPTALLSRLLEDMTVTSSQLDAAFVDLIAGLPRPKGQKRLLGHKVDYVWERERVAVELDGYSAHVSLDAFQRDRAQGNALQLAGWLLLRFTWDDVHRRPRATLATLRRALRR